MVQAVRPSFPLATVVSVSPPDWPAAEPGALIGPRHSPPASQERPRGPNSLLHIPEGGMPEEPGASFSCIPDGPRKSIFAGCKMQDARRGRRRGAGVPPKRPTPFNPEVSTPPAEWYGPGRGHSAAETTPQCPRSRGAPQSAPSNLQLPGPSFQLRSGPLQRARPGLEKSGSASVLTRLTGPREAWPAV